MRGKRVWSLILLLLFLGVFAYILSRIDLAELVRHIRAAELSFIVLAVVSMALFYVVLAINYRLYFGVSFFVALLTVFSGEFFNVLSPGANVGGEPVKGHLLAKLQNKTFSQQFSGVMSVRLLDGVWWVFFGMLSLLFGVIFLQLPREVEVLAQIVLLIGFFVIGVLVAMRSFRVKNFWDGVTDRVLFWCRFCYQFVWIPKIKRHVDVFDLFGADKIKGRFRKVVVAAKQFSRDFRISLRSVLVEKRVFFPLFVLTGFSWIFLFLKTMFVFWGFGEPIGFGTAIVAWMLPTVLGMLSFVPGGIGITETFMIGLYFALGISPELGAALALVDRTIYYIGELGGGAVSFWFLKLWKRI
jgi:glycosyltransferase 2 family protein